MATKIKDPENFEFDDLGMDDEVNLDDIATLKLTDSGNIVMNLDEINDFNDIPCSTPISPKSREVVVQNVEEIILNLMESGDKSTLLLLTGERPDMQNNLDERLHCEFASEYIQACLFNPAIKWYSRLANILTADQFNVREGSLNINIPKAVFQKVITPFIGDFDRKFYEVSPLVKIILDLNDKMQQNHVIKTDARNKQSRQIRTSSRDLQVSDSEIANYFDTDDVRDAGENMRVDDNNSLNQSEIKEITSSLSLSDLSNKAIANYLIEHGLTTEEAACDKLSQSQINEKARQNEILQIMRYLQQSNENPLRFLKPMAKRRNPEKDDFKWDSDE